MGCMASRMVKQKIPNPFNFFMAILQGVDLFGADSINESN
jgi:hypothetical protein